MNDLYQIRLACQIDQKWSAWFDDMVISELDEWTTLLTGRVRDDTHLHGILARIRDLALPLISVNRIPTSAEH